jgi:hypothetical protein
MLQLCNERHARGKYVSEGASADSNIVEKKLGREERYRTVISGMEPRRIAVVMLLPLVDVNDDVN